MNVVAICQSELFKIFFKVAFINHFLKYIRYFYQNFAYPVVLAEVENNSDVSGNSFENTMDNKISGKYVTLKRNNVLKTKLEMRCGRGGTRTLSVYVIVQTRVGGLPLISKHREKLKIKGSPPFECFIVLLINQYFARKSKRNLA